MAKFVSFALAVVLAAFVKSGYAIRCWTCSSDLDPFCNDPFLAGQPLNTHHYHLTNCDGNAGLNYPYLRSSKSVCKKQKQYVSGELTIIRGCTWKRADDYDTMCPVSPQPNYIRTTFCETCEQDGCNGASAVTLSAVLLAVPLALLKLFK